MAESPGRYTPTKLTERQWLITHSDTFREWFGDWETVENVTKLYYGNLIVMTEGGLKEKLEKAARDNGINIAADADSIRKEIKTIFKSLYPGKELSKGYREPGRVKNLDGELISITVSSAKELRHHSTNPRTLFLAVNLDSVIENATFLYEEVKDESRVKKSNQTTLAYRYYATRVVVNGEECIARIIVRKDKNGNLYFYDGDITSNEQIKKDLSKYLYPDTKTGQNLGKSLFTHSIQEWLAKVKETTDKIGGNGEVLPSVVNDFEESSTYHQMAGEHARNTPEEAIKKEIANCAPRVLASKNEASVPPGKEFAISIPNIQKELGIVKKDANRKKAINEILQRSPNWLIPEEKVDNLLSAPNVANEEDLVKLKSENPTYYQTAADKDLVVYHNVSAGKLREAIKLGGLPMPSLAITKRDIPSGDFGEITLIGDKDMIDPRKSRANEVFSREAYTVRKPVVNYEELTAQDRKAFEKSTKGQSMISRR